ncbi:MAG TPA: response regulator transcription factor [Pirellulales bacterium]|jgi:DNA-binding NarL/FixJ family response regulator|nr:response regulator transcription factor [Pirellulales bacterium]
MATGKIRLMIIDDHEVVRTGLESLVEGTEIDVVASAAGGGDAVKMVKQNKPDVVLLDIRMAQGDGLETLEELRQKYPELRVIMLSTYDNPTYVARANALGASDYVLKGSSRAQMLGAIKAAAAGEAPSQFGVMKRVASAMATRQKESDSEIALTQRETQVLRHLALGLSNREIGRSLKISIETVKEHVQHLLRKINATDRTQAAVWAVRKGMV